MMINIADIFYQKTTFGDSLRRLRRNKGLSLLDMMKMTGIYHVQLSEYESGMNKPSIQQTYKICDALNLEPAMRARMMNLARDTYDAPAGALSKQGAAAANRYGYHN